MTDITKYFKTQITHTPKTKQSKSNELETTGNKYFNLFTKDLFRSIENVNNVINANQEKYLVITNFRTTGFSDDEKEKFDSEIIKSIKIIEKSLDELNKTLEMTNSALHCQNKTEFAYKRTAIKSLFTRLKILSEKFKRLQMIRVTQRKKINKIFGVPSDQLKKPRQSKNTPIVTSETTPQNDELIKENLNLLVKFDNDIEAVQQTQNKMMELSKLITAFSHKVLEQDATTEQILELAEQSYNLVNQGNTHLTKANKYNESYGIMWTLIFLGCTIFLLIFDYIN